MTMDEFEDLVLKYLDGQTTAAEDAELNRQLKSDPARADFFVRISKNEAWVQAHHSIDSPFDEKLPPARPFPLRRPSARPTPASPRLTPFAIAAGVLFAFVALLILATSSPEAPRSTVQKTPLRSERVDD